MAEQAAGAGTGAVGLWRALLEHEPQQVLVGVGIGTIKSLRAGGDGRTVTMPTITDTIPPTGDARSRCARLRAQGPGPGSSCIPMPAVSGPPCARWRPGSPLLGYAVLLPDVYYRNGQWAPFDMKAVFADKAERTRIFAMMKAITPEVMTADATAFFDYLAGRPEVAGERFGTTGYCMGGRTSLIVAGRVPERWQRRCPSTAAVWPPTIPTARTCWPAGCGRRYTWAPRRMTRPTRQNSRRPWMPH